MATRDEIRVLLTDAGLALTSPPGAFVNDAALQTDIQNFVAIYGQTDVSPTIVGMNVWHADTIANPGTFGSTSTVGITTDDRAWVGDNGWIAELAGTAQAEVGLALMRFVPEPSLVISLASGCAMLLGLARWRFR